MAFAGLKKQINKCNQYVTEKMGGAEGTKLDLDFMDMERKTDVTYELVEELQTKTKEFLQPNPTARAKMAAVKGISKLSGQAKSNTYPQPEGVLGDCMLMYGKKLGDDSPFGLALVEMGESLKQMADVKYSLDDNIKQNFLEPLHHLQTKDLKEVMHHRKKLQGRRLDFDCKRRRQAKDDEIRMAEEKFAESLHLAQMGMFNLLENDKDEAANRPKVEFVPKSLTDLNIEGVTDGLNGTNNHNNLLNNHHNNHHSSNSNLSGGYQFKRPAPKTVPTKQIYKPDLLTLGVSLQENDVITLLNKIDENWFEGSINAAQAISHYITNVYQKCFWVLLFYKYNINISICTELLFCKSLFDKVLAEIIKIV
ncbi:hypothetical protein NQ318_006874 [Aromia moschata]|uniref:BAR domain-containing protein n=1 Tax=Aromia moschata TaxID=1265417 RepID=A0AAV8YJF6_9CUCU|nr:hypothetical protein NQ318_006874 [Aromia moschata]